jgi:hypothetical protein
MFAMSLLTIGLALAAPQGQGGRASTPPDPVVEISARLIQSDGQPSAGASRSGSDAFEGYLWSDAQCALTGGENAPRAALGWKFSANVLRRSGDDLTVQIDWQRVGDQQNHGLIERTLRMGDRVQIDRIDFGATSRRCASAVQLEATVIRPSATAGAGFGGRGGMGVGSGRGGMSSGTGRGGGRGTAAAQDPATVERTRRLVQDAQAALAAGHARGAAAGAGTTAGAYTAELWLVHTVPDNPSTTERPPVRGGRGVSSSMGRGGLASRTPPSEAGPGEREEVTYQSVRFPATGAGFVLSPVSIQTRSGPASVVVMGTLSAGLENGVPTKLVVTVNRQAMGSDQPSGATGRSSTKEVPWPQSGEVISFELPSATGDRQERLALRLRIGPSRPMAGGRGGRIR